MRSSKSKNLFNQDCEGAARSKLKTISLISLNPAGLRDGSKAVGHVRELQAKGRREESSSLHC